MGTGFDQKRIEIWVDRGGVRVSGEGEGGEVWVGRWAVRTPERGRAGRLGRSGWGESDEILGTALLLRDSGLSGVSVKPLLRMEPGGGWLALASSSGRGFPWSNASSLIGTIWKMEPGSPIWEE